MEIDFTKVEENINEMNQKIETASELVDSLKIANQSLTSSSETMTNAANKIVDANESFIAIEKLIQDNMIKTQSQLDNLQRDQKYLHEKILEVGNLVKNLEKSNSKIFIFTLISFISIIIVIALVVYKLFV